MQGQAWAAEQIRVYNEYLQKWAQGSTYIELLKLQLPDGVGLEGWDGTFTGDQFVPAGELHFIYHPYDYPTLQMHVANSFPEGGWFQVRFWQSHKVDRRQVGNSLMIQVQPNINAQAGGVHGRPMHTLDPKEAELQRLRAEVAKYQSAAQVAHNSNNPAAAAQFTNQAGLYQDIVHTLMSERKETQQEARARLELEQQASRQSNKDILDAQQRNLQTVMEGNKATAQAMESTVHRLTDAVLQLHNQQSAPAQQHYNQGPQVDWIAMLKIMEDRAERAELRAERAQQRFEDKLDSMRTQQQTQPMFPAYNPANPQALPAPQGQAQGQTLPTDPIEQINHHVDFVANLQSKLDGINLGGAKEEGGSLRELTDMMKEMGVGDFVKERLTTIGRPSSVQIRPPTLPPIQTVSTPPKEEEKAKPKKSQKKPEPAPLPAGPPGFYQPAGAAPVAAPYGMPQPGYPQQPYPYQQPAPVGAPMPQPAQVSYPYNPAQPQVHMQPTSQPVAGPPAPAPHPPQQAHTLAPQPQPVPQPQPYPAQMQPAPQPQAPTPNQAPPPGPPATQPQMPQMHNIPGAPHLKVVQLQQQHQQPPAPPSPAPHPPQAPPQAQAQPMGQPGQPQPYPAPYPAPYMAAGQPPGQPQPEVTIEPPGSLPPPAAQEIVVADAGDDQKPGFIAREAITILPDLMPFQETLEPVLMGIYYAYPSGKSPQQFVQGLDKSKLGLLSGMGAQEIADSVQQMINDEMINSDKGKSWVEDCALLLEMELNESAA